MGLVYNRGTTTKRKDNMKKQDKFDDISNIQLYAYLLLLENDKYYIGITGNVKRRFETHSRGKGAQWTAKHKPVSILEVRTLGVMTMSEAAMLEDEMYREFLPVYGMKLRGGSFCSVSLKPTKK